MVGAFRAESALLLSDDSDEAIDQRGEGIFTIPNSDT